MIPRVKICGLRREADAALAVELGAAYLGCVLADDSPRRATLDEVERLAAIAGDRARLVLVFRDPSRDEILRQAEATGVRTVQPHGGDPSDAARLEAEGLRVLRVHSVSPDADRLPRIEPPGTADAPVVLDVGRGGAGQRFDWSLLKTHEIADGVLIAGGVTPENLPELLDHSPFGIDVSSGVESAPGVKDPIRMQRLFAALESPR